MRLAVISDFHGNAVALESVMGDLRNQSPDRIVCLGDITMRGPQPEECVDLLRSLEPFVVIRGNYDHLFTRFPKPDWKPTSHKEELVLRAMEYDCGLLTTEQQEWLANLPLGYTLNEDSSQIEMYHASPHSLVDIHWPWASFDELDKLHESDETNLVLFGHVHHAFVRQCMGRTIVNCGSVGTPFDGDNRASYAIVDINKRDLAVQLRRVSYDIDKAIRIAKDRGMPDVTSFESAVRFARYPYTTSG